MKINIKCDTCQPSSLATTKGAHLRTMIAFEEEEQQPDIKTMIAITLTN
jgi:DNA-binding XRE family transcriptional regulator